MAGLGRLRRVLHAGMISLMLTAAWYAGSAAGAADPKVALRPSGHAASQDRAAAKGSIAPERAGLSEGDASLVSTPAELRRIVEHTLSAADLQTLVGHAAAGAALEIDPRLGKLAVELGLGGEALARMFEVLGRQEAPPAALANVVAEMAARHLSLVERVRLLEGSEPQVADVRDAAAAAIETAEYDRADALLAEAEALEFETMEQLPEALDLRAVPAAAIHAPSGAIGAIPPWRGKAAVQAALVHGGGRAGTERPPPFVPSDRSCQQHPEHPLCARWAESSSLCDRLPNHPLCQGDNAFCRRHPDHKLCEQPPSPS